MIEWQTQEAPRPRGVVRLELVAYTEKRPSFPPLVPRLEPLPAGTPRRGRLRALAQIRRWGRFALAGLSDALGAAALFFGAFFVAFVVLVIAAAVVAGKGSF